MKFAFVLSMLFASSPAFADYTVPVDADELKPFATFPLPDLKIRSDRFGRVKIEYTLPLELTGAPIRIEVSGTRDANGSMTLTGRNTRMTCDTVQCRIGYMALNIDAEKRLQRLTAISTSADELSKRLMVAAKFEHDPIGSFTLPTCR